jgi:hypothetical protein
LYPPAEMLLHQVEEEEVWRMQQEAEASKKK